MSSESSEQIHPQTNTGDGLPEALSSAPPRMSNDPRVEALGNHGTAGAGAGSRNDKNGDGEGHTTGDVQNDGGAPDVKKTTPNHEGYSEPRVDPVVRTVKTKAQREATRGRKAGNQGRFRGEELDFLLSLQEAYEAIPKGKSGRNEDLNKFWADTLAGFWETFDWEDVREGMSMDEQNLEQGEVIERTNKVCYQLFS